MGDKTSVGHGLTTKIIPLVFVFITIIYLFPKTWVGFLQVFPAENLFFFLGILLPGLVVIYEALNIRKKDKGSGAIVSVVIFIIIGVFLIINSVLILFDLYDPRTDTSDYRIVFAIIFGLGFLILVFGAIWEINESERYHPHNQLPLPISR